MKKENPRQIIEEKIESQYNMEGTKEELLAMIHAWDTDYPDYHDFRIEWYSNWDEAWQDLYGKRWETDAEYYSRIEIEQIDREKSRKAQEKQDAKDLLLYQKLHKKFKGKSPDELPTPSKKVK